MNSDNLNCLIEMAEKETYNIDNNIILPGLTIVHLSDKKALEHLKEEHKSRNSLVNVLFHINIDTDKGKENF